MPKKIGQLLVISVLISLGLIINFNNTKPVSATTCPEIKIIFARGSGAERSINDNYLEFKNTIEAKIKNWAINYEFEDLNYEARGIDINNIWTLIGAFFGAGDSYDFGASVDGGVELLLEEVAACPDTKFVLGGYSQGAMVVSQAIHSIDSNKIIYAATFGDPKIYLPEGKAWFSESVLKKFTGTEKNIFKTGLIPAACKNENLSDYRMYVPDCYAYEGMLGSYRPYQPKGYAGKLGTWCNKYDMFCSSYLSASSHTSYVEDGLYEDASRVITSKIAEMFNIENTYTSPHDTAILIDTSASMNELFHRYKAEALEIARKTLEVNGRVALYDYRDLDIPYHPVERCSFETCTLEIFETELNKLVARGNNKDSDESLLSASFNMMKKLNWNYGATKSVVVLTDAMYHNPDLDGVTFDDVVNLSKSIDPVNFYILTLDGLVPKYQNLADKTGGLATSIFNGSSTIGDLIIKRFDALSKVEEESNFASDLPILEVLESKNLSEREVKVYFKTDAEKVLVILNDVILGLTEDDNITISELDENKENRLLLVPLSKNRRGEPIQVELKNSLEQEGLADSQESDNLEKSANTIIPKAPNSGRQ